MGRTERVARVWDLPVRIVHVGLVASVAAAWLTGEHPRYAAVHVFAGHAAAALLAFRFAWGFVGTRYARWRAWVFAPREVVAHLRALVRGDAPRHVGHNPVAAWVMLGGLALIAGVSLTGALAFAGAEQQGPLAGIVSVAAGLRAADVHAALVWGLLAFVAVHLAGVAKESLRTRENLPLTMLTGRKATDEPAVRSFRGVAAGLLLAGALGGAWTFKGWLVATPERPWFPYTPVAMADDTTWREACGECHLAFHPALLPARSWTRMLDEQGGHFGEDLALDEATIASLRAFHTDNAAEAGATEWALRIAASVPADESPQRVTELPWWVDRHESVSEADWDAAEGRLRCAACHADGREGSFEDGAMTVPTPSPTPVSER